MPQPNEVITDPVVELNSSAEKKPLPLPQTTLPESGEISPQAGSAATVPASPSYSSEKASRPPAASETQNRKDHQEKLRELRQILLGDDALGWRSLQERIENPQVRTRDVGQVLPGAISLHKDDSKQLIRALTPTIEDAIEQSARVNTKKLSDALYPVIGPAIRAAVSHALSSMVQSLNETLNNSVSAQGLKWRMEAWQSGKSFGEVVLLKTLLFRVEQVFLIHKETGLLLLQETAPAVSAQDPQLVSGMLTAIQDFVRDSFKVRQGETLESLEVGEMQVWMEHGPKAVLAASIRGEAPEDLRQLFQEVLENIHRDQGAALHEFSGETSAFEISRPELERCLQSQLAQTQAATQKKLSPILIVIPLLILAALGTWLFFTIRENRRWDSYLTRLQNEPGLVIVRAEKRRDGYFLSGLRDPLAADPQEIIRGFPLNAEKVNAVWDPYLALTPEMIQLRSRKVLQAPDSVTLTYVNGTLMARGEAPASWVEEASRLARVIPGVSSFQYVASALQLIRQSVIEFPAGSAQLGPEAISQLDQIAAWMQQAVKEKAIGQTQGFTLIGLTDDRGTEKMNQRLRQERAETVRTALIARGVEASLLRVAPNENNDENRLRGVRVIISSR